MNIAVFLGSSKGNNPIYMERARELGQWIGLSGHTLVYGGSNTGLMGALAEGAVEMQGKVIGAELKMFQDMGFDAKNLTEMHIFDTMAERKKYMLDNSNVVIVFPGGPGTLEELGEAASSLNLGLREGHIIIYNINGYYDGLKDYRDKMIEEGFVKETFLSQMSFASNLRQIESIVEWME